MPDHLGLPIHYRENDPKCPYCHKVVDDVYDIEGWRDEKTKELECGTCYGTFSLTLHIRHEWSSDTLKDKPHPYQLPREGEVCRLCGEPRGALIHCIEAEED